MHHHIGIGGQAAQDAASGGSFQVGGDALLVGVQVQEQAAALRMRNVIRPRAVATGGVAHGRRLQLDHISAGVGQQFGAVRRREHRADFQHAEAGEKGVGHGISKRVWESVVSYVAIVRLPRCGASGNGGVRVMHTHVVIASEARQSHRRSNVGTSKCVQPQSNSRCHCERSAAIPSPNQRR